MPVRTHEAWEYFSNVEGCCAAYRNGMLEESDGDPRLRFVARESAC